MKSFDKEKAKACISSAICVCAIALLSLLFSLTAYSQFFVKRCAGTDSSVFQYVARIMQNGGTPYLDTFDHKGPFLYVLNLLARSISPEKGLWIIELFFLFSFFFIAYKIARLFCRKCTSVLVLIPLLPALNQYFEGGNLTEEYALPFIAGAIYIFTDYFLNSRITRFRLFLCGASLGAVILLRVNMIAVWVVMCLGVLYQCIVTKNFKKIPFFLLYFLLGFLSFILPFILWLGIRGGLKAFWSDYILFNFLYAGDDLRANNYAKLNSFLYFLQTPFTAGAVGILGVAFFKKKDLLNLLYALCFGGTLLFICISGQTYNHYGMVLLPLLILPIAYLGKACDKAFSENHLGVIFLAAYLLISTVLPTWQTLVGHGIYVYQNRGGSNVDPNVQTVCTWIESNTKEDDPILVCGNFNEIYNRSNRFAPTRYSYQSPICSVNPEMEEEFFKEIEEDLPAAIFLPLDFFAYERMQEYIQRHGYILSQTEAPVPGAELYLLS